MEEESPLVSVVMPCFNAQVGHLDEALASVYAQTYEPVEVVIVDDGSTDPQLLTHLNELRAAGRVVVLRQENLGPAAARNAGVRASHGKYVLPVDSDDRIAPDYLSKAVAYLEDHPETPLVYGEAEYFGARTGRMEMARYSERLMLTDNMIHNSAVYKRADFDRVGGYNSQMIHGLEDHEFWLRLLADRGAPHKLEQTVLSYRIKDVSRNADMIERSDRWVEAMGEMLRRNHAQFAKHPDVLFRVIADSRAELEYWKGRYWRVDRMIRRLPHLERAVGHLRRGPMRRWM